MPLFAQITSRQNSRVKKVVKLRQRRQRDAQRLTVVEGGREALRALQSRIIPQEAFVCPELITTGEAKTAVSLLRQLAQTHPVQLFEITPELFAKMAYREDSGGLLLVVPYWQRNLSDLALQEAPFLTVIEGIEKPGNLGAILRTADAAGVDGVILSRSISNGDVDLHNPNTVRASLGAIFSVPTIANANARVIDWLQRQGIQIIATTPAATVPYTAVSLTGPVALAMGSEARGLSDDWLAAADAQVMIPMRGIADSLNLSVAAALLLYEVVRQRTAS
ncbi:MAG: RNA methyltransferase [Chloroflexi bacterium]|nr:RNA methyltransferase [Chloroflexota bacterium]